MKRYATPVPVWSLLLWFAAAAAAAFLRATKALDTRWFPVLLILLNLLPVLSFVLGYFISPPLRNRIQQVRIRRIVLVQTWRVAGLIFIILYLACLMRLEKPVPAA